MPINPLFKILNTFIIVKEGFMENLKTKLGKRIKYLRKSQNITQEKLAEMINMDITSLSKIETGRNYPQPETIERLAAALNTDISQLFSFSRLEKSEDYLNAIIKNINVIQNDENKLKILYNITSSLI